MSQWEYRLERLGEILTDYELKMKKMLVKLGKQSDDDLSAVEQLNELGSDGWELVAVIPDAGGTMAVFKRPAAQSR